MIDTIKEMQLDFSAKRESPWLQNMVEVRDNYNKLISDREQQHHAATPIHPDRLAKDLTSVIDTDATLIVDSFTLSGYTSQWFTAHEPARLSTPGRLPRSATVWGWVLVCSSDGRASKSSWSAVTGVWVSAGWIWRLRPNTTSRLLPCCGTIVRGDRRFESMPLLKGRTDPFDMIKGYSL